MPDHAATLILPFKKIWLDLAAQTRSWTTVQKLIVRAIELPGQLGQLSTELATRNAELPGSHFGVVQRTWEQLAGDARELLLDQQNAMFYPALVGTWSIVEAAFDQVATQVIATDPQSADRLFEAGVKTTTDHVAGSDEWAEEMYARIEKRAKSVGKGSVVATHREVFACLGISFMYPDDRSRAIEELNQVRNCILHNQGVVDAKAARLCPRLAQYKGTPVPATDPVFAIATTMIQDYTLAWVAALLHGPLLSNGLKADAKNPFAGS